MIKAIIRFIEWCLNSEPPFDVIPDMTNCTLDMQYLINAMGENTAWPRVGDLVIKLESCSMGMTVRRDKRYRVSSLNGPYPRSFLAYPEDGENEMLYLFYLRRHTRIPRVWILCD